MLSSIYFFAICVLNVVKRKMWSIILLLLLLLIICICVLYVTNQRFSCYVRKHGSLVKAYSKYESGDASDNLFIRYGGLQTIQAVVDQAVTNLLAEESLADVFSVVGQPNHRSGVQLKACLDIQFANMFGFYTPYPSKTFTRGVTIDARSMKASHAGLKITTAQFNTFVGVLAKTLLDAGVTQEDVNTVSPALNGMITDIVTVV